MYRIKLSSGQELAYESNDAFAAAVRGGAIGPDAEIYHARTDRWLSVTMHPQYQRALQAAQAQPPQAAPVPGRVTRRRLRLTRPAPTSSVTPPASDLDFVQLEPQFDEAAPAAQAEPVAPEPQDEPEPDEPQERPIEDLQFIDLGPSDPRSEPLSGRPSRELKFIEVEPAPPTGGPAIPPPIVQPPVTTPLVAPRPLDPSLFGPKPVAAAPTAPEPLAPAVVPEPEPIAVVPEPIESVAAVEPSAPVKLPEPEAVALPAAPRAASPWSEPVEWSEPVAPAASVSPRQRSGHRGVVIAGIAGLMVMVGGLIAWQPWRSEPELRSSTAAARAGTPINQDDDIAAQRGQAAGASGFMQVQSSAQLPYRPSSAHSADSVVEAPAVTPTSLDVPVSAPVVLPSTIEHRGTLPISPTELASHYAAAYAAAQQDLRNQVTAAGFSRLLLPVRLADAQSVARANRAIAAATEAVSGYRDRESMIEQAYQDTLAMVGQQLGLGADELKAWDARRIQRENAATVSLTNNYLQELGALFGLLAQNEGAYHLAGDSIRFDRPEAAQAYTAARNWLMQHAEGSDSASPTVRQMLRAVDGAELPGVGR